MRRIALYTLGVVLLSSPAWATPTITYTSDWQGTVSQFKSILNGLGSHEGVGFQWIGEGGTLFPVRSELVAPVTSGFWGSACCGWLIVDATRTLNVGDNVTALLSGQLIGELDALSCGCGGGGLPQSSVAGHLFIDGVGPSWSAAAMATGFQSSDGVILLVNDTESLMVHLAPGLHTLSYHFDGGANGFAPSGSATLTPRIAFIQNPEPASWLLLLVPMAYLLWHHGRPRINASP